MTTSDGAPTLSVFAKPDLLAGVEQADDLSLLRLIADQANDADRANAAWKVFYGRYKGWLWTKCHHVARDLGGETWVEDIFLDTMECVYRYAHRFHLPANVPATSVIAHIKAWLGKITSNNLRNRLEGHYDEVTIDDEAWAKHRAAEPSDHLESTPTAEQQAFRAAFAALSEREQVVLRVTFQYHRFGADFQRLPNHVVRDLADQLGTTPENLRTIRSRALRKLGVTRATTSPAKPQKTSLK
jgi:RNA polymerase sigma factor (sigma-70 family)